MLRRWLVGQSLLAACVALLTGAGLLLLGAPFPFALALLAGLMEFVPYVGPFLAAVPAILVGFAEGPQLALYIGLLFVGIQLTESYVLAPLVQHRAVHLPPAAILFAQVLMGAIVGALGVAVATPLAAAVMVAVSMLYVEDALGDKNASPATNRSDAPSGGPTRRGRRASPRSTPLRTTTPAPQAWTRRRVLHADDRRSRRRSRAVRQFGRRQSASLNRNSAQAEQRSRAPSAGSSLPPGTSRSGGPTRRGRPATRRLFALRRPRPRSARGTPAPAAGPAAAAAVAVGVAASRQLAGLHSASLSGNSAHDATKREQDEQRAWP